MRKNLPLLAAFALFLAILSLFQFSNPNIADGDSFFYLRQAIRYRTEGFTDAAFPFLPYTVITAHSASLWYGFSILLVPFSFFSNPAVAIKTAGIVLGAISLFLLFLVARRHKFALPLLWPAIALFSAPNVLFRFLMTRSQLLTWGFAVILFSFLVTGGFWGAFLASFGIAWSHLNLVWIAPLSLGAVLLSKLVVTRRFDWRATAGVIAGCLAGWLARPNPVGALKLFGVQILQQTFEKEGGLPLLFGAENLPLTASTLFRNFSPFLALWLLALGVTAWAFMRKRREMPAPHAILLMSSAVLSVGFFALTLAVARRAYDFWILYGVISIGAAYTYALPLLRARFAARRAALALLALALLFLAPYSTVKTRAGLIRNGYRPDELREVGEWLNENSPPEAVVFNLHWSAFSPLFFWNQENRYVGGLDPIFQYAYNPSLYWKFHYLSADEVTKKTCGASACTAEMLEDTHTVLKNDFNAAYVVLEKQQNPAVYFFLDNDDRFKKVLDTKREAIYEVL